MKFLVFLGASAVAIVALCIFLAFLTVIGVVVAALFNPFIGFLAAVVIAVLLYVSVFGD